VFACGCMQTRVFPHADSCPHVRVRGRADSISAGGPIRLPCRSECRVRIGHGCIIYKHESARGVCSISRIAHTLYIAHQEMHMDSVYPPMYRDGFPYIYLLSLSLSLYIYIQDVSRYVHRWLPIYISTLSLFLSLSFSLSLSLSLYIYI
jgi:hypothetical protein